jgi:hypothetical protein
MQTIQPSTTGRRTATNIEPLVVSPREAWRLLSCGNTHGYALINRGELQSFLDGRARKITVASIRAYIARKLAAAGANSPATEAAPRRRRGRPRKLPANEVRP